MGSRVTKHIHILLLLYIIIRNYIIFVSLYRPSSPSSTFTIIFNVVVSGLSWGWDSSSELYILLHPIGGMEQAYPWNVQLLK